MPSFASQPYFVDAHDAVNEVDEIHMAIVPFNHIRSIYVHIFSVLFVPYPNISIKF